MIVRDESEVFVVFFIHLMVNLGPSNLVKFPSIHCASNDASVRKSYWCLNNSHSGARQRSEYFLPIIYMVNSSLNFVLKTAYITKLM